MMWSFALFGPLLALGASALPQPASNNSTSIASKSNTILQPSGSSRILLTTTSSLSSSIPSSPTPQIGFHDTILLSTLNVQTASSKPSRTRQIEMLPLPMPTHGLYSPPNSSNTLGLSSPTASGNKTGSTFTSRSATSSLMCTGCLLEAMNPTTTFFVPNYQTNWIARPVTIGTVSVVTVTIMNDDQTLSVVTETSTGAAAESETSDLGPDRKTTPVFEVQPTPGVTLTLEAGPTYVIYQNLFGGQNSVGSESNGPKCRYTSTMLTNWQPTRTEDWSSLIETFTGQPQRPSRTDSPIRLPSAALQYLGQNPEILSHYQGYDLQKCSIGPLPQGAERPKPVPAQSTGLSTTVSAAAGVWYAPTFYYPSMYETVHTYTSRQTCLGYCAKPTPSDDDGVNVVTIQAEPTQTNPPDDPPARQPRPGPNNPNNDPQPPAGGGQIIPIGGDPQVVKPEPTSKPDDPNQPAQDPPIIVGSHTIFPGQSTQINNVPVIYPSDGGGSRIIVDGTTFAVNPNPGAPNLVLTVDGTRYTVDSQGQVAVGTMTLTPGGPAVTFNGKTLSLAYGGAIAVINSVTQTLGNSPVMTPPPVITVGGRRVTATLIGGSTQFVMGDKTLSPGNSLTVDGTTYSMPSSSQGSVIVVNGKTLTLPASQTAFVIGGQSITPTVRDGTIAFIFNPSQTLTPGGVVTVSGSTFSMPASASGSVVVINGVSSTFGRGPMTAAPALTINDKTYPATIRDGTTEYILGPGITIRPGGDAVIVSGTTYSLDKAGTALVINGQTSSLPRIPASNSASTTQSSTSMLDTGSKLGVGQSKSSKAGSPSLQTSNGLDKWAESLLIGVAGWLVLLF